MDNIKFPGFSVRGLLILITFGLLAGCETNSPVAKDGPPPDPIYRFHVSDKLTVTFSDVVNPLPPMDLVVKDDGTITLIYNESFKVLDKTASQVEREIHDRYTTEKKYFVNFTATVKPVQDLFFSVGGEVRSSNRYVYSGKMTVLGAIDAAGGFTDFANKKNVQVTRANGKTFKVNCLKAIQHPELNVEIFPFDRVDVKKRYL